MTTATRSDPTRFTFTKGRIEKLDPPADGRVYVYDDDTPGLALCLTSTGTRTFYWYGRVKGKPTPERVRLDRYPKMTIDQARDAAAVENARATVGESTNDDKRSARAGSTLGDLWQRFIGTPSRGRAKRPRAPRTIEEYTRQWDAYLAPWAGRKLADLSRESCINLHNRMGDANGKYIANRVLSLLRSMFNMAREVGYRGDNPTDGITLFQEIERERFLNRDELPRFFAALADPAVCDPLFRDFFLVALFTGARRRNVQSMRWEDVDLTRQLWTILKTKNGLPHAIPLTRPALQVLAERRQKAEPDAQWVFPAKAKSGHLEEPKATWEKVCTAAGLVDVRIHDLRRTLGSWQASTGASELIIGKALGHRNRRSTHVYARLDLDPVQQSMNTAAVAMLGATPTPPMEPEPDKPERKGKGKRKGATSGK